jgi:hypothetical protein
VAEPTTPVDDVLTHTAEFIRSAADAMRSVFPALFPDPDHRHPMDPTPDPRAGGEDLSSINVLLRQIREQAERRKQRAPLSRYEYPASVAWDTTPQPTPAQNIRALDERGRDVPLSCDLTGDPLACAILRAWARQPWQEAHRSALVDRMEETGRTATETRWARETANDGWFREIPWRWPKWNRTARRGATRVWQRMLAEQFGDYENTLRDGTEDTPQGG